MRVLTFIIFLLLLGAFFIISQNKLVLTAKENYRMFITLYGKWAKNVFGNVKDVTGMIVKMEWLPKN